MLKGGSGASAGGIGICLIPAKRTVCNPAPCWQAASGNPLTPCMQPCLLLAGHQQQPTHSLRHVMALSVEMSVP